MPEPRTTAETGSSLTITGSLSLDADSTVAIDLAGTSQGLTYDFVDVGGDISQGGLLVLFWDNLFTAANGNSFDLLRTGGSFSGGLSAVRGAGSLPAAFLADPIAARPCEVVCHSQTRPRRPPGSR